MDEPPDPGGGDDSGTVPQANNFVTITTHSIISNESGLETDESVTQRTGRKRSRLNKICKHCNKKKRKHAQAIDGKSGCLCVDSGGNSDNSTKDNDTNSLQKPKVIAPQETSNGPSSQAAPTVGRKTYQVTDKAPFLVHVQRVTKSSDDGAILHPVSLGKFLKGNNFKNIVDGSVRKIGRNRISLAFSEYSDANSFKKKIVIP